MLHTLKKIGSIVSGVVVVLMVLCAVLLMGARLLGFQCYTVISGSMQPTYMVGDLLYVKKVDVHSIRVGDPITFLLNEDLVVATHRVIAVDAENQRFYTKGDANEIADQDPVHFNNVIGVPQFSIPKLGYVSDYIQHPPGMYVVIGGGVLLVLLVFLPDLFGKKREEEEAETDAAQAGAAAAEENERLKAELATLRAQMQGESEETPADE